MAKCIIGYDPGGNKNHGLCKWELDENGKVTAIDYPEPLDSFQDVMNYCEPLADTVAAIGIDTFTSWSTGPSGWRPADKFLRSKYPEVQKSVLSINSTSSSMSVNGMMLLKWALGIPKSKVCITEAHPKVCYYALTGEKYDPKELGSMCNNLIKNQEWPLNFHSQEALAVRPENEHQFDASIAALAAYKLYRNDYCHDLHSLTWGDIDVHDQEGTEKKEKLKRKVIFPFGEGSKRIFYVWPKGLASL